MRITLTGEIKVALKGGLKKYAREAIAQSDEAIRKAHPEVFEHLDNVAEIRKIVDSNGLRGSRILTANQKKEILEYSSKYFDQLDNIGDKIHFADKASTNDTGCMAIFDMTYINTDVMPGVLKSANSRLSWKAAVAHELEGHRAAALAGKTFYDKSLSPAMNDLMEEMQASIRANRYGKDLSKFEREDLLQDAIERYKKHIDIVDESKFKNLTFEELIEKLWI